MHLHAHHKMLSYGLFSPFPTPYTSPLVIHPLIQHEQTFQLFIPFIHRNKLVVVHLNDIIPTICAIEGDWMMILVLGWAHPDRDISPDEED